MIHVVINTVIIEHNALLNLSESPGLTFTYYHENHDLQPIFQSTKNIDNAHLRVLLRKDASKLLFLYALIHQIMAERPHERFIFDFSTEKGDLERLVRLFSHIRRAGFLNHWLPQHGILRFFFPHNLERHEFKGAGQVDPFALSSMNHIFQSIKEAIFQEKLSKNYDPISLNHLVINAAEFILRKERWGLQGLNLRQGFILHDQTADSLEKHRFCYSVLKEEEIAVSTLLFMKRTLLHHNPFALDFDWPIPISDRHALHKLARIIGFEYFDPSDDEMTQEKIGIAPLSAMRQQNKMNLGVFALDDLNSAANTSILGEYIGKYLDPVPSDHPGTYLFNLHHQNENIDRAIDAQYKGSWTRFINCAASSQTGNVEAVQIKKRIFFTCLCSLLI